eukprot:5933889-Amphidinium_carterae.1
MAKHHKIANTMVQIDSNIEYDIAQSFFLVGGRGARQSAQAEQMEGLNAALRTAWEAETRNHCTTRKDQRANARPYKVQHFK